MKMQVEEQAIRLRLTEADLAQLLASGECRDATSLRPGVRWVRTLRLADVAAGFHRSGDAWCFSVPRPEFAAFARERPRRDGFVMSIDGGDGALIELSVEVDVRDSRKHAAAARLAAAGGYLPSV